MKTADQDSLSRQGLCRNDSMHNQEGQCISKIARDQQKIIKIEQN